VFRIDAHLKSSSENRGKVERAVGLLPGLYLCAIDLWQMSKWQQRRYVTWRYPLISAHSLFSGIIVSSYRTPSVSCDYGHLWTGWALGAARTLSPCLSPYLYPHVDEYLWESPSVTAGENDDFEDSVDDGDVDAGTRMLKKKTMMNDLVRCVHRRPPRE
jgi:hypothetical protein